MRIIVIGGGVIGSAVAWLLAQRGASVAVLERDTPGAAATAAAGGMLSPLAEARGPGPFLDLGLASWSRYPDFVAAVEEASGVDVEYRDGGKLLVALDDAAAAGLEEQVRWQSGLGLPIQPLAPEETRRMEPAVSGELRSAAFVEHDTRVDNRRLGRALWIAASRAGAEYRLGETAVAVASSSGRVRGAQLAGGRPAEADAVVIAAGCWSGQIAGLPRPLPVEPVRGQIAAIRAVPPPLSRVVYTPGCYLIPRSDGRILVGATVERAGYRCHVTPAGLAQLFGAAIRAVPVLADAPLDGAWAGLRPGTPDDLPVLGPDPELEGLYYATGHFRNGILLAPITAELLADALLGGKPALRLEPFSPARFRES